MVMIRLNTRGAQVCMMLGDAAGNYSEQGSDSGRISPRESWRRISLTAGQEWRRQESQRNDAFQLPLYILYVPLFSLISILYKYYPNKHTYSSTHHPWGQETVDQPGIFGL